MSGKIALTATPFDLDGFSDCRGIKDRQSQKFITLYMKRCGCGSYFYKIIESGWPFQQFSDQSVLRKTNGLALPFYLDN